MRKLLTAVTALTALLVPTATTAQASTVHSVRTATYSLGELTGVVHYPKDLTGHKYPVVLMSHGLWITCADKQAWEDQDYEKLAAWPCANGTPAIPSYRGYDYAGTALAAQGMIVVSIDANSVINLMGQEQDVARASLISRHLQMWQQLSATGGGPLTGKLPVNFKGHADLMNVGLMGHSRGGRGTLFEAADVNQKNWPAGVRIKAVVPLAAAEPYSPDDDPDNPELTNYRITNIPVASFVGSCDRAVDGHLRYLTAHNKQPFYEYYVHGANHNFYNTQWSPSSGQVGAYDDAASEPPRPSANHCTADDDHTRADKQLTETHQRLLSTTYLSAFYRRYLLNDKSVVPVLNGTVQPLKSFATIDVLTDLP
ncbi:alpha/beta hydrolase [Kribbella antibiotica]|uniref:Alpha/beta hydrolase n=1 Tax=Kribbella antibiotica TaxID=190195 RepID=A0A4R4YUD5_9ACTN|nr:alpha/beta hydrolase [Kribbella antibiotica]TDD48913.1 alpha/beta hydrolase [Kribbella antibiotica]